MRTTFLVLLTVAFGAPVSQIKDNSSAQDHGKSTISHAWETRVFSLYPRAEGVTRVEFESKLDQFQSRMWQDFQALLDDDSLSSAAKVTMLNDYINLRDRWLASESIGNSVLAGLITMGVDSVLGVMALGSMLSEETLPFEFDVVNEGNELSMVNVFAQLDPIIDSMGVEHDYLSELCSTNISRRSPCWEEYISQFGLYYNTWAIAAHWSNDFLDVELENDDLPPVQKVLTLLSSLKHPSFIIRQHEPAYFIYFWAHILDTRGKTSILWDAKRQAGGRASACSDLAPFASGLLQARGPVGQR